MAEALVLDERRLEMLGASLASRFVEYENDRKTKEEQWMKNLRQFRGIYDPEIESKIGPGQSKAYPKITRQKVIGTVSRLMEMLFPQTEKNWGVKPSPKPDLSTEDVQAILNTLQASKPNQEISDAEVEKLINEVAHAKAAKMSTTIEDQLAEIEYITLARKVLFSGVLYGAGLLEGPFVKKQLTRTWSKNQITGQYEAREVERLQPFFEPVRVWDWYPDFSAKMLDQQDGYFKRCVMSRAQLAALADRPDFMGDKIRLWLKRNDSGNYKMRNWEEQIRAKGDRQNPQNLSGRKYEVIFWNGYVSGHDLRAAGQPVSDDKLEEMFESCVGVIGRVVIKAKMNPMERQRRLLHTFIYEEDDINLAGIGLPEVTRDSQMGICEATRMMFDNASVVCGPQLIVRLGMLLKGQTFDIHAFKTWFVDEGAENSNTKPVENISIDSHIPELKEIIALCMEFMDAETALPPPAMGDVSQGGSEALRTQRNASMFLGAAALPIRDTVRNFDTFTTSFITALYDWNMEFNEDASIKGDYEIIARGSTSLIAKEVRATALDVLAQTLRPEEVVYIKGKKFLEERMKVRDVDLTDLLEDDETVAQKQQAQAQQLQAQQAQQAQLIDAQIQSEKADALKDAALARKADVGADVDVYDSITGVMKDAADVDIKRKTARVGAKSSS